MASSFNMERRIMRDILEIAEMENDYILIDGENLNLVKVVITGPHSTPFEGGLFELILSLTKFPVQPPYVKFVTPVFHPNICPYDGKVCMNILDSAEWGPATRLKEVLEAARSLLDQPNPDSPLNGAAACMLRQNSALYKETIQVWTHTFAGGERSRAPLHLMEKVDIVTRKLNVDKPKAVRKLTKTDWDLSLVRGLDTAD